MHKIDAFQHIKKIGIIPAIRAGDADGATRAAEAILQGGITVIEISMGMPNAAQTLAAVVKACGAEMLVGAGTVVTQEEVRGAHGDGARFIVTPGSSPEVIDEAARLGLTTFAGALTPTEVQLVAARGVAAVKLFPCYAVGGPRYVRSLRGEYPHTELIASGGVTLENCSDYIRAGAMAIGVGAEIADSESIVKQDYGVFTVRAKRFRRTVHEAQLLWNAANGISVEVAS